MYTTLGGRYFAYVTCIFIVYFAGCDVVEPLAYHTSRELNHHSVVFYQNEGAGNCRKAVLD